MIKIINKARLIILPIIIGLIVISLVAIGWQCAWNKGTKDKIDLDVGSSEIALTTSSDRYIRVLDSEANTGQFPSVAMDSNNKTHVAFYDATYHDLKYVTNVLGTWDTAIRIDGQNGTDQGAYSSITIDSNNRVHASYYDATNSDLAYITNRSGSWQRTSIDQPGNVGMYTDIAELDNIIYCSYYDVTNGDLKYITGTSGTWVPYTIDGTGGVDAGQYTSIAVVTNAGNAIAHISYYDVTNGDLKYITNYPDGTSWASPIIVDTIGNVGLYTSIAANIANEVHISYYDVTNGNLKYAKITNGTGVITETVDSTGDVGKYSSIGIVSSTGQTIVHISYYDATKGDLKYAANADGTWSTIALDGNFDVGLYTGLAMDDNGEAHIVYYDNTYWDLKYTTMIIPPMPPSYIGASEVNSTSALIAWTDNSNNEDGFELERKPEGGSWSVVARTGVNVTSYADSGLVPQTTYYYRARAFNNTVYSFYSSPFVMVTAGPPAAPTGLTITMIAPSQVGITWTDNSTNEDGFKVERRVETGFYSTVAVVGTNINEYVNSGLLASTTYYFRVRAYAGPTNSPYSNEESVITLPPPNAPTNLTVTCIEPSRVTITWTDNAGNEDGYKIERRVGAGWVVIANSGVNITSYLDSSLSANTTYHYRVKAYSGTADSVASNEVSATTAMPPAAPTSLIASAIPGKQINLIWFDNATNEDGFRIERKADAGSWSLIGIVGTNVVYYEDRNLNAGTTYTYRIWAYNGTVLSTTSSNEASGIAQP